MYLACVSRHQGGSAVPLLSATPLIISSVPNLFLTHIRPSPNCSLPAAVPRYWEKLHSIGVELKAYHHQRHLQSTPQAAPLSSTLLLCSCFFVLVVSLGTTTLGRAAAGAAAFWVQKHHIQPEYGDKLADVGRDRRTRLARPNF